MKPVRKHKSNRTILICTLILIAIGLVVIYAIGPMRANVLNNAYGGNYDSDYFFRNQIRSVVISLVFFFAAFKWIPYKYIKKFARPFMYISLALSALLWFLTLIGSPLAKCELGECRWFNIPIISSFQPAELLKIGLVLYLSDFIVKAKENHEIGKLKEFWLPILIICGASVFLVVFAQGDLGTGVALIAIILGMLFAAGVPAKQYLILLAIIVVGGGLAVATSDHRRERIDAWVATLSGDETNESTYHIENAMMAIGTGGLFGTGIGNSVQATGYLPESINDSVFAIMGEISGFVGLALVILIFGLLLWNMLRVAEYAPAPDDHLIVVGVFSWLLAQVAVNIMAMTGLIPVTGITLPLLSYGGTSLVCVSFAIGLVLQISCYTSREGTNQNSNPAQIELPQPSSSRHGSGIPRGK